MTDQSELDLLYAKGMKSVADRLTEGSLERMRTTAIGGASLSLAIILLLLQTNVSSTPLQVALYSAALAIPVWIVCWQYVEAYIFCGQRSFAHFNSLKTSGVAILCSALGMLLLGVSVFSLIWHMSVKASLLFLAASLFMGSLVYRHHNAVRSYADKTGTKDGV
jgi:hypothetical protein